MIHTDEDDEFDRIAHEAKIKGQPYYFDPTNGTISTDKNDPRFTPLGQVWPIPAKREWVGLTDKDWSRSKHSYDFQKGVDWAEAILKRKNSGDD
jgi:hypothetical protein